MELVDVSQGKENLPILGPVDSRCFEYVKTNVPSPGFDACQFLEEYKGCECVNNCDASTCPCVRLFGCSYDDNGLLNKDIWCSSDDKICSKSVFECGQNCRCKANGHCCLRVVQKGVTANLQVFKTASKGFGLISMRKIEQLRFVCEYAGEVVSESEAKSRLKINQDQRKMNYLIAVHEEGSQWKQCHYVDPSSVGNVGRFINHSCDPNLVMVPVRVNHPVPRLALFARRDISAGEELTFDYSGASLFRKSNLYSNTNYTDLENSSNIQSTHAMSFNTSCSKSISANSKHQSDRLNCENSLLDKNSSDGTLVENCIQNHGKRTICLCGSQNCSGLLPFDESLFS